MRGRVKFWRPAKGWGAIASDELPEGQDSFTHFSVVEGPGFRELQAGDLVEFEARPTVQDSFRWVTEQVRVVGAGPAPALRRRGDRVEIEPDGTPDTPLTPRRG